MQISFDQAARLPEAGDNAALAIQRLEAGTQVIRGPRCVTLAHTVLEGHRFAWGPIPEGASLLSWGLPFGVAARDIQPGEYLCNDRILVTLKERDIEAVLPKEPNFNDFHQVYELDEDRFLDAEQLPRHAGETTFEGYARGESRGVGTRNYIAVLGTTSWTAGYARALAQRFQDVPKAYPQIDGVIPVAHTEGGGANRPNNFDLLMRTLAGFMVHPNIGAILVVDYARQAVNNSLLKAFMEANAYPLDEVRHEFVSLSGDFSADLAVGETVLRQWLEPVNRDKRTTQSMAHLKIALQCGGSDAFSGVSGNPLAGWVSRELVQNGGSANLAETSELIGAEPYVLNKVKDLDTARAFLNTINRFQEWAGWHGHSAEGNPSGGNLLRGLYNIAIKSIGAARKKDPEVRLDAVIDYSQPMTRPGFYFMDIAGNDLVSFAG
jgi:altronate dehydratase